MTSPLGDTNIDFENMPVKIVAIRKIPAINTPGLVIEEADEGNTITVNLWIAMELIEAGLAKLSDEGLSSEEWTQIHYRERFQPLGRPTPLPDDFYAKAYLTFAREMRGAKSDPIKAENLERLKGRFRDILESRIGKITRLASAEVPFQTHSLEPDEVVLYKDLFERISEWRKAMKKMGEE